jgi:hypothetical protein
VDTAPSETLALQQIGLIVREHEKLVCIEGACAEDKGDAEAIATLELELNSLQKARAAIHSLTSAKLKQDLLTSLGATSQSDPILKTTVGCGEEFLKSYSSDFWSKCFLEAFPRGDCRERDGGTRRHSKMKMDWTHHLFQQVDKSWFRQHKEVSCLLILRWQVY